MVEGIQQFIRSQQAAIIKNDLEQFLQSMTQFFIELGSSQPMQGLHLVSSKFDQMCQDVGRLSAFELLAKAEELPNEPHHIILVTELYCLGGHLEIVRDIIRTSQLPILLVASNINNRKKPVMATILDESNLIGFINADNQSFLDKLRTVQTTLANPHTNSVYMLTHGYDAVATAAIASDTDKTVLFMHHCDHYPALGCYLEGAHHIDLHNVGFLRCRNEFDIQQNRYLCLSSAGFAYHLNAQRNFASPRLKTASCGGLHKLKNLPYHLDYLEVILHVLLNHDAIHFHIGHLSDEYLQNIYNTLSRNGLADSRFIYLGPAPNLPQILTQLEVDIYLPTLPLSGGKAIIDAMAAGIPIVAHQNARDRLWGSTDLIYPGAPTWDSLDKLDDIIQRMDESFWRDQSRQSRAYFERYHSESLFVSQLAQGGAPMGSPDIPSLNSYRPEIAYSLLYSGFRQ
ncbi:hypothetical protein [Methylomonas sp. CM2]|uniref:hypothetical protein n=1 Tax=Methylomonas sp. CM2 TaxID=3417647 RepID=UPI003CF5E230